MLTEAGGAVWYARAHTLRFAWIPVFGGMIERHPRAGGDLSKRPFIASIEPGWIPAFAGMTVEG